MRKFKNTTKENIFTKYKFTIIFAFLNILVAGVLLMLMNHTQSSNISIYTEQLSKLNIQNQLLQDKIAQAQSLNNIYSKASSLGMIPNDNIVYINNTNSISYNVPIGN